jgi:8-amino-7-oxononanoate synthase
VAAAATAALALIAGPDGERRRALLGERIRALATPLVERQLIPAPPAGPILPVVLGSESRALAAADRLRARGFFVPAIRPPTVPSGSSRLRITLSAAHEPADVAGLAVALVESAA